VFVAPMRITLLAVAGGLFLVSLAIYGYAKPYGPSPHGVAPNIVAGLTTCGFAITGGLALIAAALAGPADRRTAKQTVPGTDHVQD